MANSLVAQRAYDDAVPILVVLELSGGNDGLNTVVPYGDDAYYQLRPKLGLKADQLLRLDDHFGFNPGFAGMHELWQEGNLAVVHGCGYAQPSFSHFTSMAYWHTGVPHSGNAYGWLGRLADELSPQRRQDMLIAIGGQQTLAVNSRLHTPVVFDDPMRFRRQRWNEQTFTDTVTLPSAVQTETDYLLAVHASAKQSSENIRRAWSNYRQQVDYGIAPMDLPKVAACIEAKLPTQIYHVAVRNNAFDTHVQQAALHGRLLSYVSDAVHGFIRDLERMQQAHRVLVLMHSEFGRRAGENANRGTDHGTANTLFMAGHPVRGGHYGEPPSLTKLSADGNLHHTTDFRRVYATAAESWLGAPAGQVVDASAGPLDLLS